MKLIEKEHYNKLKEIIYDLTRLCVETYDAIPYPNRTFRFISSSVDSLRTFVEVLEMLQPWLREEP